MNDRELMLLGNRLATGMERLAGSIEAAIMPSDVELEFPPPYCPHCKTLNPVIVIDSGGDMEGHILDFILRCICKHCGKQIYAVAQIWVIHPTVEDTKLNVSELKERVTNGRTEDTRAPAAK